MSSSSSAGVVMSIADPLSAAISEDTNDRASSAPTKGRHCRIAPDDMPGSASTVACSHVSDSETSLLGPDGRGKEGTSLRRWAWKRMFLIIVVPTLAAAVVVIGLAAGLSPYIAGLLAEGTSEIVSDSLIAHARVAANQVRGLLAPIEAATMEFCDLTTIALATPRLPSSEELASYGYEPTCTSYVFATLTDYGGSDAYLAQQIPCTGPGGAPVDAAEALLCNRSFSDAEIERYIWRTGALDPFLKSTVARLPITQSYANFVDGTLRIYPTRVELTGTPIAQLFGCWSDIREYEFWYGADFEHDPDGRAVWTSAYADPGFSGWVATCVGPVYYDDGGTDIEAVPGFDVGLSILMTSLADVQVPWGGYVMLLDRDGVILSLPQAAFVDWGLTELTDYEYSDFIISPTFKVLRWFFLKNQLTVDSPTTTTFSRATTQRRWRPPCLRARPRDTWNSRSPIPESWRRGYSTNPPDGPPSFWRIRASRSRRPTDRKTSETRMRVS
jgi:hypothetical protein